MHSEGATQAEDTQAHQHKGRLIGSYVREGVLEVALWTH